MSLYNLVTLKQSLSNATDATGVARELTQLRDKIAGIKHEIPDLPQEHLDYINRQVADYNHILDELAKPMVDYHKHLEVINQQINEITHRLFTNNYELEESRETVNSVRNNRRISVKEDVEQDIKQRILLHTSWRYPALEIGCRDGEWTQFMVAADPLYIMDKHQEFLDSTNSQFNEQYQNRLRKYILKDHNLSALPKNQMAFVFSWGYFNYVSLDTMKQYLRQIFEILRPGGIFMFSYNDGDTTFGAGMAENFCQSYMPQSLLIPLCESLGYIVNEESKYGSNIMWLEISKPGELHTIKSHQVLGEIKRKNI